MKRFMLMLSLVCLIVLAACTPPRRTPSVVVRPVATEMLPTDTPDGHLVEVTRVIGTAEPTATPTPKPTTTPLPLPTPTITPIPTTLATRTIEATATDCPIPEMLAQNKLGLVFPDYCIVWLDNFDNETGFIVRLGYPRSGEWFLYHTPANVTAMHIPPEDAPRLMESTEQCQNRQSIVVEVTAVFLDHGQLVAGMGLDAECDLRQLPTATAITE
jgi:hypothetical protein